MKKFKYLEEDVNLSANVQSGKVSLDLSAVRDNINAYLNGVTSCTFVTPYIALERVSKVLANYHIFLPKYTFMEGDSGLAVFNINQFGGKVGMNDDGEVVTADDSPFSFYFEYNMNDKGTFDVFAEIVDEDELQELMSDLEDEFEDEGEEEEKMNEEVVAEGRADNKAKKREALKQAYPEKKKLRDIRSEIKGNVSTFDPRELKKEEACLSGPETGSRLTPGANPTMITTGVTIPDKLMKKSNKKLDEEKMNRILEACWKGYRKKGMKTMFGKRYPNCVKDD